jgi:SnoaL-like domain
MRTKAIRAADGTYSRSIHNAADEGAEMEQDPELEQVMLRFYETWNAEDAAGLLEMVSDAVFIGIGTDTADWWDGKRLARIAEHPDDPYRVRPGEIKAYRLENVGLVADMPTFIEPDGTETPFRITLVFHEEDGGWKLVQEHISIGR